MKKLAAAGSSSSAESLGEGAALSDGAGGTRIGERIARARRDLGLTQSALADLLGINSSAVAQWETHRTRPSIEQRINLAKHLGIPYRDLMPEAYADLRNEEIADPIERHLIEVFRRSDDKGRDTILMVVDTVGQLQSQRSETP